MAYTTNLNWLAGFQPSTVLYNNKMFQVNIPCRPSMDSAGSRCRRFWVVFIPPFVRHTLALYRTKSLGGRDGFFCGFRKSQAGTPFFLFVVLQEEHALFQEVSFGYVENEILDLKCLVGDVVFLTRWSRFLSHILLRFDEARSRVTGGLIIEIQWACT